MAETDDTEKKKDPPPEADKSPEVPPTPEDKAKDNLSSAAQSADRNAVIKDSEKKASEKAAAGLPNTTIEGDETGKAKKPGEKKAGEPAKPGEENKKPGEEAKKPGEQAKKPGEEEKKPGEVKPGEAKGGEPKPGEAGEAKKGPEAGEKPGEKKDTPPEDLKKNADGSFTGTTEFPPGSETAKQVRRLDANQKLIDETKVQSDGSSITTSADKTSVKTTSATGAEADYKLDKNGDLTSYKDSSGDWSKQKDGSWKNNNTGESAVGDRWLDDKGALHIKTADGKHESKQLDGSKTTYDQQDRPEVITDKFNNKMTLGYKGDEKEPNSIDYGYGKWEAKNDEKNVWEKAAPAGSPAGTKPTRWEGTLKVENNKVTDVYTNQTQVEHRGDGSHVSTKPNGDLSSISAGNNKFAVDYSKPGEPSKITMPDKTVLEKKEDGWYSGGKKQYDSINVDNEKKSITFKNSDGSSQVVDAGGNKHHYDAKGQLSKTDGADGSKTTYKNGPEGEYQGKEVRSADGKLTTTYDSKNQISQVDRDGQRISVERNDKGAVTKLTDSNGPISFESKDGGKTFVQSGNGMKIEGTPTLKANGDYEFRSEGKMLSRTKDAVTVTSPEGQTILNNDGSSLAVNNKGEVEQAGTANGLRLGVKRETDPQNPDKPGKVTEARVGDQIWTRSKEPGKENVWTSNDGMQRKGEFNLDRNGMTFTDASNKAELAHKLDGSTVEKDANKNVRQVTTPEGKVYSYSYDDKNRLSGMTLPDGTSHTRLPDRLDSNKQPVERWVQDGTNKVTEGKRSVDGEGTLRMKNGGEAEKVMRRDGWEEKQGSNGEKLLTKENADKSTITKNDKNQIVETKTADGQVRKFGYDAEGNPNKIDLGKEGKLNSTDGGKTWTKEGTNPPETKEAKFLLTPKGDLVEQRQENGKNIEDIRKADGSRLQAEDGKFTSQTNALKETYKVGYGEDKQPNRFEDPKDKGAYWTSSDNKTWTKHNADGSEDKGTQPQKFAIGFDSQGNLLKQNNEKEPANVERMGTDGSTTLVSPDGRKLNEKVPDGKGKFTETTFSYDKDNRYTGKEVTNPDGTKEKSDAMGRTTEASNGKFKRTFAYENDKYPNLVTSYNDNGTKFSLDKAALEKGQVVYKNDAKPTEQRHGAFEVGKDGSMTLRAKDGFELTDRIDGTKLVRNPDGSMLDYRADGKLASTRDVNGNLKSYKYDLPQDVLGRKGQLSEVTYGEGPNAVTHRTSDGYNWVNQSNGKVWKGFSSVDHSSGTLTDKHYYGNVAETRLDGKEVQRPDLSKNLASSADEVAKTVDWWKNSNAIEKVREQMSDKTAEQLHMMKDVYADRTGRSLYNDMWERFDKGSDTHRWAEVEGYLNAKGNPGEKDAIQLAVDAQEIDRWWINRDRSKEEIRGSTRRILGGASEEERQNFVNAYNNLYGRDMKTDFSSGGVGAAIKGYDKYHETLIGTALEKGKDKRTPQEEAAILNSALQSGGRKLDYFMEAAGGLVTDKGRQEFLRDGGKEKISSAFTETRSAGRGGGTYQHTDRFGVQQATDFAETGALRPHTAIQKAAGVFSNDDNVIEHTLNNLKPEQRAQFADGMKLAQKSAEEKANLSDKEKESLQFYNQMMDSFKGLHYFGAERKAEKYIDQTLHKGGTDVSAKVAPIGGHWTNSNQVNAEAIEKMDQKTFTQLMSGQKGSVDEKGVVKGGVEGNGGTQYLSEFHKQMSGALEKNLGGGEYNQKAQDLLNKKIAEGVAINEAADKGDWATLRDKVPAIGNIKEADFKQLAAGHDLQKAINENKIKESELNPEQQKQLAAYKEDKVFRPFMEGREVARALNDIESGARADRLFKGQELEKQLTASGAKPTEDQQKLIDFYKQNSKEIEGLSRGTTSQVIERQREAFNKEIGAGGDQQSATLVSAQSDSFKKQLGEQAGKSLEAYQKTLYESVQQNTGRDLADKIKDNQSMWGNWNNDTKNILDNGLLNMSAKDRRELRDDPSKGAALREELKTKFAGGSDSNAAYQLADSLLKQIETSKDNTPAAPTMGPKEQLLARAAGIEGYKDKDAVALVTAAIKDDKDGSKSKELANDPEFKKAAITALGGNEAAYNSQIKPLLENGRINTEELKERHTHMESHGEGDAHPVFDPKGFFKEGILEASPRALAHLNSPEGAAEKQKMLDQLKGSPELHKLAENILNQGEVRPEDKIRAFTLDAGMPKAEALAFMKDMPEGKRMEMQLRFDEKYENYRASVLSKVDNKEYNEFFRATRAEDWGNDQAKLHAIKTVLSTDAGIGAAMARNYNVTHIEALNDFQQKLFEGVVLGKPMDLKTQEQHMRGIEDRVTSFQDTKKSTADTAVTGLVTVGSLAAAPFTAGASLYALAGISLGMGLTAAGLKYGLMGNDANGGKEFAGDAFKYTALAFANQFGAGNLGLGEAANVAGATSFQAFKTQAGNVLIHSVFGGVGNTVGEGGRQLIDEGKLNSQGLQVAFAQGFIMTGAMSGLFKGVGAAFKGADAPNVPGGVAKAGDNIVPEVAAGTAGVTTVVAAEKLAKGGVPDAPVVSTQPKPQTTHTGPSGNGNGSVPKDSLPGATVPKDNVPGSTVPKDHVPGSTAPKDGVPGSTAPKDGVPGATAPKDGIAPPKDGPVPVEAIDRTKSLVNSAPESLLTQAGDRTVMPRAANPTGKYAAGDYKLDVGGQSISLDKPTVSLGRAPGNDGVFTNGTVSGKHAEIQFKQDGPVIKDVGSRNGTFVNGERIPAGKEVAIKPGDKIRLGPETEFTFGVKPEFHFEVNGRGVDLNPNGTNIGRSSDNNFVLADNAVSRKHANIANSEQGPVLTDLGSKNGTYVNGTQLEPNKPYLLKPGDKVQFGKDSPVHVLGKGMDTPAIVNPKMAADIPAPRKVMEYSPKPGEANPAAAPEAVKASNAYKEAGEIRQPVRDGFQTLSGDKKINADGTFNDPNRPALMVDRTRDTVLNDTIAEAHRRFDHLKNDPRKLAEELTKFSKEKMHPKGWSEDMVDASYNTFRGQNKGKQVLLGDYIDRAARGEGAGVCQHQALLNKVLGDEFGLDVSLVSGFYGSAAKGSLPKDTFANHAWNEYHIDGKTYVFDPRHEALGKTAAEMPKHHPAREWISGPDAKPVGRFEQLNLKNGDIVNHDGQRGWSVSTEKPKTPGNIVLTQSATRYSAADEIAALNPGKKLSVGEKYTLRRSNGDIEEGWQLMGTRKDGALNFYKPDGFKAEVTPQELVRQNPDLVEVRAQPQKTNKPADVTTTTASGGPRPEIPKDTPGIKPDSQGWEFRNEHGAKHVLTDANTPVHARENVTIYAEAGRQTEFFDQSKGIISGKDTHAFAHGESTVDVHGASVAAGDNARVTLHNGSVAELTGNSTGTIKPSAWEKSTVHASGDATVNVDKPTLAAWKTEKPDITLTENAKANLNHHASVNAQGPNTSVNVQPGVDANVNLANGATAKFDNATGVVTGDGVVRVSGDKSKIVIDAGDKPVKIIVEGGNPTIEIKNGKNVEIQAAEGSNPKINNTTDTNFRQKVVNAEGVETGKVTDVPAEGKALESRDSRPTIATSPDKTMQQVIDDIRKVDPQLADELLKENMTVVTDFGSAHKGSVRLHSADGVTGGVKAPEMEDLIKNPGKYPELDMVNAQHELVGHRAFDKFVKETVTDPKDLARFNKMNSDLKEINSQMLGMQSTELHKQYLNSPPELAADYLAARRTIAGMEKDAAALAKSGQEVSKEFADNLKQLKDYQQSIEHAMKKVENADPSTKFYFDKAREFAAKLDAPAAPAAAFKNSPEDIAGFQKHLAKREASIQGEFTQTPHKTNNQQSFDKLQEMVKEGKVKADTASDILDMMNVLAKEKKMLTPDGVAELARLEPGKLVPSTYKDNMVALAEAVNAKALTGDALTKALESKAALGAALEPMKPALQVLQDGKFAGRSFEQAQNLLKASPDQQAALQGLFRDYRVSNKALDAAMGSLNGKDVPGAELFSREALANLAKGGESYAFAEAVKLAGEVMDGKLPHRSPEIVKQMLELEKGSVTSFASMARDAGVSDNLLSKVHQDLKATPASAQAAQARNHAALSSQDPKMHEQILAIENPKLRSDLMKAGVDKQLSSTEQVARIAEAHKSGTAEVKSTIDKLLAQKQGAEVIDSMLANKLDPSEFAMAGKALDAGLTADNLKTLLAGDAANRKIGLELASSGKIKDTDTLLKIMADDDSAAINKAIVSGKMDEASVKKMYDLEGTHAEHVRNVLKDQADGSGKKLSAAEHQALLDDPQKAFRAYLDSDPKYHSDPAMVTKQKQMLDTIDKMSDKLDAEAKEGLVDLVKDEMPKLKAQEPREVDIRAKQLDWFAKQVQDLPADKASELAATVAKSRILTTALMEGVRGAIPEGRFAVFLHGSTASKVDELVAKQGETLSAGSGRHGGKFFATTEPHTAWHFADRIAADPTRGARGDKVDLVGIAVPESVMKRLQEQNLVKTKPIDDRPGMHETIFSPQAIAVLKEHGFFFKAK